MQLIPWSGRSGGAADKDFAFCGVNLNLEPAVRVMPSRNPAL